MLYLFRKKEAFLLTARFKEIRKAEHLTQAAFAERLGVTRNYVYMIESGNTPLTDRTITDVCREFGIREEWLRTGNGAMYRENSQTAAAIEWAAAQLSGEDTFQKRFLEVLSHLPAEHWEMIEELVEKLSEGKKESPDT